MISSQCDKMVKLCFNICPFATMKISPELKKICQSKFTILPNKKYTMKNLSKTNKILPKL